MTSKLSTEKFGNRMRMNLTDFALTSLLHGRARVRVRLASRESVVSERIHLLEYQAWAYPRVLPHRRPIFHQPQVHPAYPHHPIAIPHITIAIETETETEIACLIGIGSDLGREKRWEWRKGITETGTEKGIETETEIAIGREKEIDLQIKGMRNG